MKNVLYSLQINTRGGPKSIHVVAGDILEFDEPIDILTTSAFLGSYHPTPGTMFAALASAGICVHELADDPLFDLREKCDVWLSRRIPDPSRPIGRIGCVEMGRDLFYSHTHRDVQKGILTPIRAYFQMLDLAALADVEMGTIAMPMLGAGSQQVSDELTLYPLLNECIEFLKRTPQTERIIFIDRNFERAFRFAKGLSESHQVHTETVAHQERNTGKKRNDALAFISYSSPDRNVADNLCAKLENAGIRVWYAPRNVHGDYASSIAKAIGESTYFVVILSENSMRSQHVLNEIDLAFKYLPDHISFKPLRLDHTELSPAFDYYLSRQHWMEAQCPPLENRLTEFVQDIVSELQ